MKRKIDFRALVGLVIVLALTVAAIYWAWTDHLESSGEITCYRGGTAPPSCTTTFGDRTLWITVVAAPLIGWLTHKAFFSKFGRS